MLSARNNQLNKQDELFRDLENKYGVSLDYKHIRIEQLRKYKKEVVHNKLTR